MVQEHKSGLLSTDRPGGYSLRLLRTSVAPNHAGKYLSLLANNEATTKITVENVNVPGYTAKVDRVKYEAMKKAMFRVLPKKPQGLTQQEIRNAVLPFLPDRSSPATIESGGGRRRSSSTLRQKGLLFGTPKRNRFVGLVLDRRPCDSAKYCITLLLILEHILL
jgi:hypothetical protein